MLGLGLFYSKFDFPSQLDPTFIFTVKTDNTGSSNDDQFTIPCTAANTSATHYGRPLMNVDWGDGNTSEDVGATVESDKSITACTHTYDSAGTYTIKITQGTSYEGSAWESGDHAPIQRFSFANGGDKLKILEIQNWGVFPWGIHGNTFYGCSNLTVTAEDKATALGTAAKTTVDLTFWFRNCTAITTIGNWDFSACINMRGGFWSAQNFNDNISNWYLGKNSDGTFHTDFAGSTCSDRLFFNCNAFEGTGLDAINVSQASGSNGLRQIMANTALTTANYDALLIAWNAGPTQLSTGTPTFNSTYTAGGDAETARSALIAGNWAGITDLGAA